MENIVSEKNPIRVFVSHVFEESDDYLRVFEFLESVDRFYYLNASDAANVPENGGIVAIKDAFIEQIKASEAVVILASIYAENLELIKYQLDVAEANKKPIIVIRPFGGTSETAPELAERAHECVRWNERELVDAIKRHARLEETSRWDVVDFP
jgi:hypothetical protein